MPRSNHALSFAATEYAREDDDPVARAKKFEVAHTLRRLEPAEADGATVPILDELRLKASVPDTEEDEFRAPPGHIDETGFIERLLFLFGQLFILHSVNSD